MRSIADTWISNRGEEYLLYVYPARLTHFKETYCALVRVAAADTSRCICVCDGSGDASGAVVLVKFVT